MEPEWMKKIPSESICNFFYFFFVVYAVLAVLTLLGTIGFFAFVKMPKAFMVATGFQSLIMFVLAGVAALFHYLICDRALLMKEEGRRSVRGAREMNPDMMM